MPSELEGVEIEQRLEAEDRVVADADVVDVVALASRGRSRSSASRKRARRRRRGSCFGSRPAVDGRRRAGR